MQSRGRILALILMYTATATCVAATREDTGRRVREGSIPTELWLELATVDVGSDPVAVSRVLEDLKNCCGNDGYCTGLTVLAGTAVDEEAVETGMALLQRRATECPFQSASLSIAARAVGIDPDACKSARLLCSGDCVLTDDPASIKTLATIALTCGKTAEAEVLKSRLLDSMRGQFGDTIDRDPGYFQMVVDVELANGRANRVARQRHIARLIRAIVDDPALLETACEVTRSIPADESPVRKYGVEWVLESLNGADGLSGLRDEERRKLKAAFAERRSCCGADAGCLEWFDARFSDVEWGSK